MEAIRMVEEKFFRKIRHLTGNYENFLKSMKKYLAETGISGYSHTAQHFSV